MGWLGVVERSRRQQNPIGRIGYVRKRESILALFDVLDHLDARDQVIPVVDRLECRTHTAVTDGRASSLRDGVFREVGALGIDTSVPKCLDEKSERTPDIERRRRRQFGNDPIGDAAEEAEPMVASFVRQAKVVGVVVRTVEIGRVTADRFPIHVSLRHAASLLP